MLLAGAAAADTTVLLSSSDAGVRVPGPPLWAADTPYGDFDDRSLAVTGGPSERVCDIEVEFRRPGESPSSPQSGR